MVLDGIWKFNVNGELKKILNLQRSGCSTFICGTGGTL